MKDIHQNASLDIETHSPFSWSHHNGETNDERPRSPTNVEVARMQCPVSTDPDDEFTTEHNHHLRKKGKSKEKPNQISNRKDILEMSKKNLMKNSNLSPIKSPSDMDNKNQKSAVDWTAALLEKKAQKRGTLMRYASSQLLPIGGRRKKMDLGRIAPDSVIAPSMVLAEGVNSDVYHQETVVAASLVSCYTISKTDFFNHVPKDTKAAIQKVVREYKAPILNPLWENAPRILDDTQWRMEKAWEKFRTNFSQNDHARVNILDSLKSLSNLHLSATSGNDPLRVGSTARSEESVAALVTMDWGLPAPTARSVQSYHDTEAMTFNASSMKEIPSVTMPANAIRNRLNESHAREISLREMNNTGSLDPLGTAAAMRSNLNQAPVAKTPTSNVVEQPFVLIQVHREYHRSNPTSAAAQQTRRVLHSYLRLCGCFPSIAKAKELADTQLEQVFLSVYQSDLKKQQELLLQWNTFKGFESIPVDDSEHFIIYCRSSPMEYASICPSKNIFFAQFPAICKPPNQRYAVIVLNQIIGDESPWNQTTTNSKNKALQRFSRANGKKEVSVGRRPSVIDDEEVFDSNNPGDSDNEITDGNNPEADRCMMRRSISVVRPARLRNQQSMTNVVTNEDDISTAISSTSSNLPPPLTVSMSSKLIRRPTGNVAELTLPTLAPSPTAGTIPQFISTKKATWPLYLQELSSVYETLVITSTRIDGLRYAIKRFGSMPNEVLSCSRSNGMDMTMDSAFGEKTSIHLKSLNDSNKFDRILRIVHQEQKRICVIPLFRWVLLNDDTLDTLNFLGAFKESTIRKILLAEEFDQNPDHDLAADEETHDYELDDDGNMIVVSSKTDLLRPHIAPGEYRDVLVDLERKKLAPDLLKSFSEAGFIPRYMHHAENSLPDTMSSSSPSMTNINDIENSNASGSLAIMTDQLKALKILEKEIESKEMSTQIRAITMQPRSTMMGNASSPTLMPLGQSGINSSKVSPTANYRREDFEDLISVNSASNTKKPNIKESASNVELRLSILNNTVSEACKVMSIHDQLCHNEHGDDEDVSQSATKGRPKESRRRFHRTDGELMRERLHVIESLQKMNMFTASKPTVIATTTTPTSGNGGASNSNGSNAAALFGISRSSAKGFTQSTAAGKRLADSLRVLSESLDNQFQQKITHN
jgi:hypothetical protein